MDGWSKLCRINFANKVVYNLFCSERMILLRCIFYFILLKYCNIQVFGWSFAAKAKLYAHILKLLRFATHNMLGLTSTLVFNFFFNLFRTVFLNFLWFRTPFKSSIQPATPLSAIFLVQMKVITKNTFKDN